MTKCVLVVTNLLLAVLLAAGLSPAAEQKAPAAKPAVEKQEEAVPVKAAAVELIDINTAAEEQLKKIPGIGDEYAKKIIAGRPYVKKDQLKSRKILPVPLYDKVRDKIIARQIKGVEKK